jgi:hypothetical protein
MDDNIKIRAGTGLQAVLQSTINFPQAFTELAKNSLQNGATVCNIDVTDDMIKVSDNGNGFDHMKVEDSDMSDFEKYFVFGNSYDLNAGEGPKLGRMGIGGKISNDKLSEPNDSHWQIYTKNKHGKCFVIDYDPPAHVEFFEDYSPSIKEISQGECPVKTDTGTEVRILNVNQNFLKTNHKEGVKNELLAFFAHLVISYQNDKKMIDIVLNGEKLKFSIDLNGNYRGTVLRAFQYEIEGETKWSVFRIALNQFAGNRLRRQKRASFIKSVELVSEVKICDLHITDGDLIEKTLARLSDEEGVTVDDASFLGLMSNFIGYVNCMDLSKVLDERGMPAKDLSHHGLRSDHPMTMPFLEEVYYVIMKLTYHIAKLSERTGKRAGLNKNLIAYNVAKLLAGDFSQDMEILTDKKMLGLDKVEKIDKSHSDKDLILEKLIGDMLPPGEGEDGVDILDGEIAEDAERAASEEDPHDGVVPDGQSQYPWEGDPYADDDNEKESEGHKRTRPRRSEDDTEEDKTHRRRPRHHGSEEEPTGTHRRRPRRGGFAETTEDDQYTKVDVEDFRSMLRRRSELRDSIAELERMIADGDDSPETLAELERLRRELADLQATLGKIQLFYAIEHMDDEMVISELREYNDGFIMVINENNVRYSSIQGDIMALALHVAEAMIKEIIYIEDEEINKARLDKELSMFYKRHFETLKGDDLLSM